MKQPRVLILSPALAAANNGNWQTAWRWSQMLSPYYQTKIAQEWDGEPAEVLLALHARRSASSIARWAHRLSVTADAPGLGLVLTGTDLYRDILSDPAAQASLRYAQALVVLQERGPDALPPELRHKAQVIFQSSASRAPAQKTPQHLRALMVGHLRAEKSPQTLFAAAALLAAQSDIFIDHIGAALEPELGAQAQACASQYPHYRWLGSQSHSRTLRHIQHAHVLVHSSRIEGGAHVVLEAVCSGTPVLASRIPGNLGMLGENYPGYFELDDAAGLAALLQRCRQDQELQHGYYQEIVQACTQRAPLFSPAAEQAALLALVQGLLAGRA
ncbi:selenoneine biosynthesis selenosugar synthase SenB [Undibacterium parvum]|uniref:TIGR04348 family glycosyltransferase n=2 Tax=Undibacterium TaxID=401469 RepID=A0A6M4A4P7_9BURK|nr:selenoneine biosynthesis selenosugar synthase SenB [Undibacterium parvum]AZP11945.1 TIGR04348 family glycosyltransferase [Undibacterium parvum]QJQ06316.1 TIGR04348 family glycosyltransferase [Undibacterium piscinae]